MLRLSRLFWVMVLAGAFVALDDGRAEATTGLASWYGPGLEGNPTASGDAFDASAFTAAHKTLPFGTWLTVSYRGRSAQVVVNDRGPYTGGRDLDLSQGAAEYLGLTSAGVDYVNYTVIGRGGYGTGHAAAGQHRARQLANYGARSSAGFGTRQAVAVSRSPVGHNRRASGRGYASGRTNAGGGSYYVVRPGDTMWEISAQLGTNVHRLAAANGIANPEVISAGQRIRY